MRYVKEIALYIVTALGINLALGLFYYLSVPGLPSELLRSHLFTQQLMSMICLAPLYPFLRREIFGTKVLNHVENEPHLILDAPPPSVVIDLDTSNTFLLSRKQKSSNEVPEVVITINDKRRKNLIKDL